MTKAEEEVNDTLLKIAVPNKGSLAQAATEMLINAGYRQRTDSKEAHAHRR